jgi:hypothetical protein
VFARKRGQAAAPRLGIREWIVKRGILYVLTQAPVIGIFCGFFFRIVPFGTAAIGEIVAFYVLFTWVAHRKGVSIDPDEPVHQLAHYTIWALVPCVAFSLARIPTHLGFGFAVRYRTTAPLHADPGALVSAARSRTAVRGRNIWFGETPVCSLTCDRLRVGHGHCTNS